MPENGTDLPDDANQSEQFPYAIARASKFFIKKPTAQATTVAKFEKGENPRIPKAIHDYDDFIVTYPSDSVFDSTLVTAGDYETAHQDANLTTKEWDLLDQAGVPMCVDRP